MVLNSNISNGSFTESQGTRYKMGYLYNDSGQRTRKTVYQGDGISIDSITIYHYDQRGYLITETTETGALIKDYIWQQGLHPVAQIDASMPAQAGMPSEGIIYLHTDHLLTNRLATDATRKVIWRWEGEAFGNTPALGSVSVNLRFPGQYYDAETNLHYNHFRYYDPELGRYITSDPIGIIGGMNTYGYVEQNPIRYTDRFGLHHDGQGCVDPLGNRVECPANVCLTGNCAAGLPDPELDKLYDSKCAAKCSLIAGNACNLIPKFSLKKWLACRAAVLGVCLAGCEIADSFCK